MVTFAQFRDPAGNSSAWLRETRPHPERPGEHFGELFGAEADSLFHLDIKFDRFVAVALLYAELRSSHHHRESMAGIGVPAHSFAGFENHSANYQILPFCDGFESHVLVVRRHRTRSTWCTWVARLALTRIPHAALVQAATRRVYRLM